MTRPIQQSVTLSTVPRELFNTFLDSKKHTALTGAPAKIGKKAGAAFTAFGGQLSGRTLLVVPGRLIVQSWRSNGWKASDPDSILILEFSKTKSGGRIDLVHVGVPQHDRKGVTNGWKKYYWDSLATAACLRSDPMSVDVVSSILINRSRALVSGYAANPDHAPEWYVNIKAVEWKTSPPVTIGSQIAFVAHFLGRRMAYTYEIVELVPGERLVMRTAEGPFPMETSYIWETTPEGATRMTLRNRGTPSGFSKWLAPFIAGAMRRANRKDLAALKQRLESSFPR